MRKRQAATAIAVYHEDIQPSLTERAAFVRRHLERLIERRGGETPTALELVHFIDRENPGVYVDVNTVRPRLSEMKDSGWVREAEKRTCRITGKRVTTWASATPSPEPRLF